ncbi:MAG: LysM peptidoglycan-binding domain-containing protein [Clostridia bacterium]|nr:LysM peptidoglycan-binding domain-containing protein [Clostridia bacterium]
MQIHTKKRGESLSDIAKKYGVSEETVISTNTPGIKNAAIGEELLILVPTRTYTLKKSDTMERLCLRFRVRQSDILAQNPWITNEGLTPGRSIVLKYDDKMYGTAAANGYFYKGSTIEKLRTALPYLTYVTVGGAVSDESGVHTTFNADDVMEIIISESKIPLIRVYDTVCRRNYGCKEKNTDYIQSMIKTAKKGGYKGIVLSPGGDTGSEAFYEFILDFRKSLIGCDLILIVETDENSSHTISDFTDGCILSYPKYSLKDAPSFEDGEKRIYSEFACYGECSKTFIELPSLAKTDSDKFLSKDEAISIARMNEYEIETDKSTSISHFENKNSGRISFSSLGNIKNILDIIEEYGYMGIAFDIERTPISHLLMYNSLFRTASHTSVRAPEGCARGG